MQCLYYLSSQAGTHCQGKKHRANNGPAAASPNQESQGILPEIESATLQRCNINTLSKARDQKKGKRKLPPANKEQGLAQSKIKFDFQK